MRVNFTVRFAAHRLSTDARTLSPVSVPSGSGRSVVITQISDGPSPPHSAEARPTATQTPPIWSKVMFDNSAVPPPLTFAAVATQPPAPHSDRTAQLLVVAGAFGTGLSSRSVPGP